MPREIYRSRAIATRITGTIMIRIRTDMYHHCGPRVAFWAATVSGRVWARADDRKSAIRYSFQANTRTNRKVATRPGVDTGSTIERKIRYGEAPSTAADSSSSTGIVEK